MDGQTVEWINGWLFKGAGQPVFLKVPRQQKKKKSLLLISSLLSLNIKLHFPEDRKCVLKFCFLNILKTNGGAFQRNGSLYVYCIRYLFPCVLPLLVTETPHLRSVQAAYNNPIFQPPQHKHDRALNSGPWNLSRRLCMQLQSVLRKEAVSPSILLPLFCQNVDVAGPQAGIFNHK